MFRLAIAVFIGSGLGGVCRFLLTKIVGGLVDKFELQRDSIFYGFPWGTFAVNVIGCLLIGLIYGLIDRHMAMSPQMKLLLTTGFCGGLTTFSTFSHENLLLFNGEHHLTLILYAVLSLVTGFAAAWLGHVIVR